MKKFLLFLSTVFFSLLIVNKVYAQELPAITMRIPYVVNSISYIQSNENTYEFYASYGIEGVIIEDLEENEYFMYFDMPITYRKGIDRRTNSYELIQVDTGVDFTEFLIRMTILKSVIDDYGDPFVDNNIEQFLNEVPILYIKYIPGPDSIDYQAGYNDGYNNGYNDGFQVGNENGYNSGFNEGYDEGFDYGRDVGRFEGYNDGYDDGYEQGIIIGKQFSYEDGFIDGQEFGYNLGYDDASKLATSKFQTSLHVWIVPAIIIVVIAGIFVGYRRERYNGD